MLKAIFSFSIILATGIHGRKRSFLLLNRAVFARFSNRSSRAPEPRGFPTPEPTEVIETESAVSIFEKNPEVVLRKGGWKPRPGGNVHEHWVVLDDEKFDNFVLAKRLKEKVKEKVAKGELTLLFPQHFTKKMFDEFGILSEDFESAEAAYNIQPPHTLPELFGSSGEEILSRFQKLKAELKGNTELKGNIKKHDVGKKITTTLKEQMPALDSFDLGVRFSNHLENVEKRFEEKSDLRRKAIFEEGRFYNAHTDNGSRFIASIHGTPTMFLKTDMEYISISCEHKGVEEHGRSAYLLKRSQVNKHNGDIFTHEELAFTVYKSDSDGKFIKALHATPMESCAEDENRVLVVGNLWNSHTKGWLTQKESGVIFNER